jgi:hypothetical protein
VNTVYVLVDFRVRKPTFSRCSKEVRTFWSGNPQDFAKSFKDRTHWPLCISISLEPSNHFLGLQLHKAMQVMATLQSSALMVQRLLLRIARATSTAPF